MFVIDNNINNTQTYFITIYTYIIHYTLYIIILGQETSNSFFGQFESPLSLTL